jgi:hypothetical protein
VTEYSPVPGHFSRIGQAPRLPGCMKGPAIGRFEVLATDGATVLPVTLGNHSITRSTTGGDGVR